MEILMVWNNDGNFQYLEVAGIRYTVYPISIYEKDLQGYFHGRL